MTTTAPTTPRTNPTGYSVNNSQQTDSDGNVYTETTFTTLDTTSDVQITEDLSEIAFTYYDDTSSPDSSNNSVLQQIQFYASEIKCSNFHGKGTIDDYTELFEAASRIANESKHMQLDVDIEGFNEFATAADQLSSLFTGFIAKLENVSIIDDNAFLTAVANALEKIWNLSKVFGKFKETIIATSTVQLPKSAHDAKVAIETVMANVNCAMQYINHFVDASNSAPSAADLSAEEKAIIHQATVAIDNWNILCEQGVSIAMSNNSDIQYIKTASDTLKNTTATLTTATNALQLKMQKWNFT